MTRKLFYNIQNNGDGSASLKWFESESLASWDANSDIEGFSEDCSGSITVESDSDITVDINPITTCGYFIQLMLDHCPDLNIVKSFYKDFFKEGFPEFFLVSRLSRSKKYHYLDFYFKDHPNDSPFCSHFFDPSETATVVTQRILDTIREIKNSC